MDSPRNRLQLTGSPVFFVALPQANENDAPMVDLDHHHHQVVRSAPVLLDDEKTPHKHDDVACCG